MISLFQAYSGTDMNSVFGSLKVSWFLRYIESVDISRTPKMLVLQL